MISQPKIKDLRKLVKEARDLDIDVNSVSISTDGTITVSEIPSNMQTSSIDDEYEKFLQRCSQE